MSPGGEKTLPSEAWTGTLRNKMNAIGCATSPKGASSTTMDNFSDTSTSVTWAYFRSRNSGMELSSGPDDLLFREGSYLLALHLGSKSFSAQITNGAGFPQPLEPRVYEMAALYIVQSWSDRMVRKEHQKKCSTI
jgi:hypothetical protein